MDYMVPGHTKFSPDQHFGVARNLFKNAKDILDFEKIYGIYKTPEEGSQVYTTCKALSEEKDLPVVNVFDLKFLDKIYKDFSSHFEQCFDNYYFILSNKCDEIILQHHTN